LQCNTEMLFLTNCVQYSLLHEKSGGHVVRVQGIHPAVQRDCHMRRTAVVVLLRGVRQIDMTVFYLEFISKIKDSSV